MKTLSKYIFVIEFTLIAAIGIIQEIIYPAIGSLICSIFSLSFLVFSILEAKDNA